MSFLDTINAAFTNNNGTASSNLREQAPHSVRTYRAGSNGASRALYCGPKSKTRQTSRIRELGSALAAEGLVTLDEQARALDLSRSTAWAGSCQSAGRRRAQSAPHLVQSVSRSCRPFA
jgi:hypothetical protein